jgi:hypothetical protein
LGLRRRDEVLVNVMMADAMALTTTPARSIDVPLIVSPRRARK